MGRDDPNNKGCIVGICAEGMDTLLKHNLIEPSGYTESADGTMQVTSYRPTDTGRELFHYIFNEPARIPHKEPTPDMVSTACNGYESYTGEVDKEAMRLALCDVFSRFKL